MPRYATKAYVRRQVNKPEWSSQYITTMDFSGDTVDAYPGATYNLTRRIQDQIDDLQLWSRQYQSTDGVIEAETSIKLDYVKIQLRFSLGESETLSAVSQNVRVLLVRLDQTLDEYANGDGSLLVDDLDGNVKYMNLYGNKFGLYFDKFFYIRSIATDSDTTAGGQFMLKKFKRPKISDVIQYNPSTSSFDSEKGVLVLYILGNNPDGTNALIYGYVELGWRYQIG